MFIFIINKLGTLSVKAHTCPRKGHHCECKNSKDYRACPRSAWNTVIACLIKLVWRETTENKSYLKMRTYSSYVQSRTHRLFGIYQINVYKSEQNVVTGASKKWSIPKVQESNYHRLSVFYTVSWEKITRPLSVSLLVLSQYSFIGC